jgi:hypothetical protein
MLFAYESGPGTLWIRPDNKKAEKLLVSNIRGNGGARLAMWIPGEKGNSLVGKWWK